MTEKGLKVEADVHFLKSIHKAIMEAYRDTDDNQSLVQVMSMAGPAFGVNSRINLDLKFKDYKEIE